MAIDVLDDPLMFLPEVEQVTRLSATTIWRKEKNGEFPPRHRDGQHVSWFTSQIRAYMEKRRQNPSGIGPAPSKANEARRRAKEVGGEPLRASRRVSRASAKRTTDTEITD